MGMDKVGEVECRENPEDLTGQTRDEYHQHTHSMLQTSLLSWNMARTGDQICVGWNGNW